MNFDAFPEDVSVNERPSFNVRKVARIVAVLSVTIVVASVVFVAGYRQYLMSQIGHATSQIGTK